MPSDSLPNHPVPRQIPRLEVEDTVLRVGPLSLSLRQAALLLIGGCVAWSLWKASVSFATWQAPGLVLRVLLVALPTLVSLAFAFGKRFGRRYDIWITVIWRYLWLPKIAIWRRSAMQEEASWLDESGSEVR
jgi:drug/metabolite transporter superfamily protein YnfA